MHLLGEERAFYEGLTRHNYFPNQKDGTRELPPCFSTRQFTPEIVELLVQIPEPKDRRKIGYDHVEFLATRYNNVPRALGLIHPKAYAYLSQAIYKNWDKLKIVQDNKSSMIKPELHQDGRIMVMNYEDSSKKNINALNSGFGKQFRVHTDIASCFHSIYSHSIQWAAIGFDAAKAEMTKKRKKKKTWYEDLDFYQRQAKRNETQGIPIGPATSSIVVEFILRNIDQALSINGFEFKRYIDDYVCYCESHEQAQRFIQVLGRELNIYKLNINLHKTHIVELPEPINDDWVAELAAALPNHYIDEEYKSRKLTETEIVHYLDLSVKLNKSTTDGSVVKYAVSSIIRHIGTHATEAVLEYVINLAWHYPILLPYLDSLLELNSTTLEKYTGKLNAIVVKNAKNNRSDGMAWPLYLLNKFELPVTVEAFSEALKSKDCIALICLYESGQSSQHIIDFANAIHCGSEYEKDKYWLLLYQIYLDGHIDCPYGDGVFELLKEHAVNFLPEEKVKNITEQYIDYLLSVEICSFFNESETVVEKMTFNNWKKSLVCEVVDGT